jgi:arginyl-tRNA synthetase
MEAYLTAQLRAALRALATDDTFGAPDEFDPDAVDLSFQAPKDASHGDLATSVALQLARPLKRAPRQIAEALAEKLRADLDADRVESVEIAGPGFLNLRFSDRYLRRGLADILEAGDAFGRTDAGGGRKAIVEYVSANPTGPLTVGHGRNAVLGDTLSNLLDWTGYDVVREYYFNDAGRQMRVLGQSVRARYAAIARPDTPTKTLKDGAVVPEGFPDEGYLGGYIEEIAQGLYDEHGDALLQEESEKVFKEAAEQAIFADITGSLDRLGIRHDEHFNERSLYDSGAVWTVIDRLKEKDLAYEEDGATWFATGKLGKTETGPDGNEQPKDTVLVKSSGEPTYRLPDIAYHLDKLERTAPDGLVLDVFGSDHIATYPDVLRGIEALGGDPGRVDVVVYQFVTLVRGGEEVKMSTRKANYVTLDELAEEVGPDVVRFFFLMLSPNTHLNFDLDLAKEATEKNPVFYLQYAHARISSILRKAEEQGLTVPEQPDLDQLTHEQETALMKELLKLPDAIAFAAERREPHRLASYLRDVAVQFSQFYRDCHILGEERPLAEARLALASATRTVLKNGLTVLGLSAPEQM